LYTAKTVEVQVPTAGFSDYFGRTAVVGAEAVCVTGPNGLAALDESGSDNEYDLTIQDRNGYSEPTKLRIQEAMT